MPLLLGSERPSLMPCLLLHTAFVAVDPSESPPQSSPCELVPLETRLCMIRRQFWSLLCQPLLYVVFTERTIDGGKGNPRGDRSGGLVHVVYSRFFRRARKDNSPFIYRIVSTSSPHQIRLAYAPSLFWTSTVSRGAHAQYLDFSVLDATVILSTTTLVSPAERPHLRTCFNPYGWGNP